MINEQRTRQTGPVSAAPEQDSSLGGLVRQLFHEVPALLTKEVALAKAELGEAVSSARNAVVAMAGGAAVLMGGFLMLLLSAVFGLSLVVAPWLAALIVGVVVSAVGLIMLQSAKKRIEPASLAPERTINSLQKDKAALQRKTS